MKYDNDYVNVKSNTIHKSLITVYLSIDALPICNYALDNVTI